MRKIAVLLMLALFTVSLNATITKEDIYNANAQQFEELKKELSTLNKTQSEELKKAYQQKELVKAFKTLFSNKELLKNNSYAVIKNGKIVKLSDQDDEDGLLFWHEHSPNLQPALPDNYCLINEPSWENTNLESPCGVIKYQLEATSPYNEQAWDIPYVYLMPPYESERFQEILNTLYSDTISGIEILNYLSYHSIHTYVDSTSNPERKIQFLNNEVVTDIVASAGYTYSSAGGDEFFLVRPYGPLLATPYEQAIPYVYRDTEFFSPEGNPIISLKTGQDYAYFLAVYYKLGENWWDGYEVVLRWFFLDVKNAYLDGDVGIENNNKTPLGEIKWNNRQITINLEDSVNPNTTTYELYDMSGKLIQKKSLKSNRETFNIPSVASGVYLVKVKGKNINLDKKIVYKK